MKKQNGITLIALVITIIIMLILVAVTVSYGIKSGLLTKAKDGGAQEISSQEKEQIGSLYQEYLIDKETDKLNGKTFTEYMCNKQETGVTTITSDGTDKVTVKFTASKNEYTLTSAGIIKETRKDIGNNNYMGKYYISKTGGCAWKFIDSNNIIEYDKSGSEWYYENFQMTELYENLQIIDETDSDFINYCSKYSIDKTNIGNYIRKYESDENSGFCYFNLDYTIFYDGYVDGEPYTLNLVTDSEIIALLENAQETPKK